MLREIAPPKKIKKTFFGPFRTVFEPFWIVFRAVLAHFRIVLHDFQVVFLRFFSVAALRRRCSAIVASARRRRGAAASARRNLPRIYPPSSRMVSNRSWCALAASPLRALRLLLLGDTVKSRGLESSP